MAILNITTIQTGLVGVTPQVIYIATNDTFAEVSQVGYLTQAKQLGYAFDNNQMALVTTSNSGVQWMEVVVNASTHSVSLQGTINPGTVVLPVVANDFVNFSGTGGLLYDAGFSATNPAKTKVVMANAAVTIGNLASYTDTAGTIQDSAVPVVNVSPLVGMTNGQVVVGRTGTTPVAATLTAGAGINIANASGSITISTVGSGTPWTIVAGASQAMVADNGYVANNAGLVTLTLPATAAAGTILGVAGLGAGGWLIAQNAGQNIQVGSVSSTIGAGGSVASTNRYDSINLLCVVANTTWVAIGAPQSAGLTIV